MYGFEHDYEGCEHIIESLYDFAMENDIPVVRVDDELRQAYWQHKRLYDRAMDRSGFARELRIHSLDVHLLEDHVMSELERVAKKR